MFKKTINYIDFNGKEREKTLYFNLSEAELLELERSHPGGWSEYMKDAVAAEDPRRMHEIIQTLINLGYGEKSEDGEFFMKTPEILSRFKSSAYYSELMMDLFSDQGEKLGQFMSEILPANLTNRVRARLTGETIPENIAQPQDYQRKQSHIPDYPRVESQPVPTPQPVASTENADYNEYLAWKRAQESKVPDFREAVPTDEDTSMRPPHQQGFLNG